MKLDLNKAYIYTPNKQSLQLINFQTEPILNQFFAAKIFNF